MTSAPDDRGVAPVVGAVLIFAILIVSLSVVQAHVVPDENRAIELRHGDAVQDDLLDVRNAILTTAGTGTEHSVSVRLGTAYPSRTIFVNPPDPTGRLSMETDGNRIVIENAVATGGGNTENVAEIWGTGQTHEIDTGILVYEPRYFEYDDPPTVTYEHSLLYSDYGTEIVARSNQRVIDGNRITLVALQGDIEYDTRRSVDIDSHPVSVSTNSIRITGDGGDNITIRLPTRMSNESHVANFFDPESVTLDGDDLVIELAGDETYRLRLATVSLDDDSYTQSPAYITNVGSTTVSDGNTVTLEVRDELNNPVAGVEVDAGVCGTETTDQYGRVAFDCDPGEYTASIGSDSAETIDFEVVEPPSGDGTGELSVDWNYTLIEDENENVTVDESNDRVEFTADLDMDTLIVFAEVTPPIQGANLEFSSANDAIASIDDSSSQTGNDSIADTTITPHAEGETSIAVEWGNSLSDEFTLEIIEAEDTDPPGEPNFEVTIDDTNSPVTEGETLTVDVTIQNTGDADGTQSIELDVGGEIRDSQEVTIASGDSQSITLEWATEVGDAGDYMATVSTDDDSDTADISVEQAGPPIFTITDLIVTDQDGNPTDEFNEGDTVQFEVSVENTGEQQGTQDITVTNLISSQGNNEFSDQVDPQSLTLDAGESDTVVLVWDSAVNNRPNQADVDYTVTVESDNDDRDETFTVLGS